MTLKVENAKTDRSYSKIRLYDPESSYLKRVAYLKICSELKNEIFDITKFEDIHIIVIPECASLFIDLNAEESTLELEYKARDALSNIRNTVSELSEKEFEKIRDNCVAAPISDEIKVFECFIQICTKIYDFHIRKWMNFNKVMTTK